MGGKPPLTCLQTVVDLELDDVLEETHPCYSLVWDNEMTWQCAEYLNNSDKTEEIQCGHSADVCTSIRFSLVSHDQHRGR